MTTQNLQPNLFNVELCCRCACAVGQGSQVPLLHDQDGGGGE